VSFLFDALIRGSIRHRHLVLFASLAWVVFGLWFSRSAHFDALPSFAPPMVIVQTEAAGMGSEEVEERITTTLERGLLGIPEMTSVRSRSSSGLSVITLTFEEGLDLFLARQLVGERIALVREQLPTALASPQVAPIVAPVGALLKFTYTLRRKGRDKDALRRSFSRFAEWQVRPRLLAVEGVSRVTVHGGAAQRIEVRQDPARLAARGITLDELGDAVARAQSLVPLGHLATGSQREEVRADGLWSLDRLAEIENTPVTGVGDRLVRVRDVADVRVGAAPPVGTALYDGEPAIYVQVDKLPWADTIGVTERVEKTLAELDAELPPLVRREPPVFRQADFIHTSLVSVGRATGIGIFFVILVLVTFLRSTRLAAISLTALPLSLLTASTLLLMGGVTINGMILGGLAIAVGEVVDDAIVDAENIWRRLRENASSLSPRPPLEVIHEASAEVRGSVVYASFIVVCVLSPLVVLGGFTGRIFSPLATTYALAVAASLFVALTVTPALCASLLPAIVGPNAEDTTVARRIHAAYEGVLRRIQNRPGAVTLSAALLGLAALLAMVFLGGGFLPEFREGVLIAEVTTLPGTSLAETTRLAGRIDETLRDGAGLPHVAARIGRASLDDDAAPVYRMEMDLVLGEDTREPEEVGAEVMAHMAEVPGVRFTVDGFLGERINELLSGERAPVVVALTGDELEVLRDSAARCMAEIERIPGVESVSSRNLFDIPTTEIEIRDADASRFGLRRSDVVRTVAAFGQGLEVAEIKAKNGFSVPVVLAQEGPNHARSNLSDLPVWSRSPAGSTSDASPSSPSILPLSSLATLRNGSEPPVIDHVGGRRVVTVTASAPPGRVSEVARTIERSLSTASLPPGVSFQVLGQAAERRQASRRLLLTTLLVLAGVFSFLWLAFDSVVDAAVVLVGLPLGMVGGVVTALLLPDGVSMAGLVGFVALAGVISRNGIMLVAHKNHLIAAHPTEDGHVLVLRAARERVLPILMTAATAFFGMLPLAFSMGTPGSELEAPMALIVATGLLTATVLNLIAVPAFYLWRLRRSAPRERAE